MTGTSSGTSSGERIKRPRFGPKLIKWPELLAKAAAIVNSYDTGVTVRQLFYRLVSAGLLHNTTPTYKHLCTYSAKARREGTFPALLEKGRGLYRRLSFASPDDATRWLPTFYRRDRTEGQEVNLYLGVEKAGMMEQLQAWFTDLGVRIFAVEGYTSQTLADKLRDDVEQDGRPAVLVYAGDFDPSGEDILRDLRERANCWREVHQIAVLPAQIAQYNLLENPGKESDPRSAKFREKYGTLVQVEVDAIEPDEMRRLYQAVVDRYWDDDAYERVLAQEADERRVLERRRRR